MKKVIFITLNAIALVVAIIWLVKTNYDYEPQIVIIGLFLTLIGLLYDFTKKNNNIIIKGNQNQTLQDVNSKIQNEKTNQINITGDGNKTAQDVSK